MVTRGVRRRARGIRAAMLGVVVSLGVMLGHAPTASAADLSDVATDAFADLTSCIAANEVLLVSIVVDESASLKRTDPQNQRVEAVQAAVDALAGLEAAGGVTVETNLSIFGGGYGELVGWGPPSGAHGERLQRVIAGDLAGRNGAQNTDYRVALQNAQASVDARRAAVGGAACGAVLWFTDGKLDVGTDGAGPEDDAARDELCTPNGIVDGIRAAGTTIIALALFTPGDTTVTAEDRERLRAVAEGVGEEAECGTVPLHPDVAGGAYLSADDPSALSRLFSGAGALIQGFTQASIECPGAACPDGVLDIHADRAVGGFRVIFESDAGTASPVLTAPTGAEHPLTTGADGSVATTSRDRLHVTDVDLADGAAHGTWQLHANGATVIDLYYRWGAALEIQAPDGLIIGEEANTVLVTPLSPDGQPQAAPAYTSIDLEVTVDGQPTPSEHRQDGTFEIAVALPADGAPSEIEVAATATASSAPNEVPLGTISRTARIATQLPATYPVVTPASLDLGRLTGDDPARGTLVVAGPAEGATRACFGPASFDTFPEDAGALALDVPECVDVPAGERVTVDVSLVPQRGADGVVNGSFPVELTGANADEPRTVHVPVRASMLRPVNEAERWALVTGLMLLAAVIAMGIAWVGRHLSDRYPVTRDLRFAAVPVTLTTSGVLRRGGDALLEPGDFRQVGKPGSTAAFSAGPLDLGRRGPLLWPWKPYTGVARSSRGGVVVTGRSPKGSSPDPRGSAAAVKIPGTDQFYLVVDEPPVADSEPVKATLVLLAEAPQGNREVPRKNWSSELATSTEWAGLDRAVRDAWRTRAAEQPTPAPAARPAATRTRPGPALADPAPDPFASNSGSSRGAAPDPFAGTVSGGTARTGDAPPDWGAAAGVPAPPASSAPEPKRTSGLRKRGLRERGLPKPGLPKPGTERSADPSPPPADPPANDDEAPPSYW